MVDLGDRVLERKAGPAAVAALEELSAGISAS
jgi:hypothetical protein